MWHGGPVAVPDVSAYLSVSQWFAGGVLPDPLHFFPGYGMLLAPVGWLSGSALHDGALVFNGMLAGCCVFGAATLAGKCGGSSTVTTGVAALAAGPPSISMASRSAWPGVTLAVSVDLRSRFGLGNLEPDGDDDDRRQNGSARAG